MSNVVLGETNRGKQSCSRTSYNVSLHGVAAMSGAVFSCASVMGVHGPIEDDYCGTASSGAHAERNEMGLKLNEAARTRRHK